MTRVTVKDLEALLKQMDGTEQPLKYNEGVIINNPRKCLRTQIKYIKSNPKNRTFLPYYERALFIYNKFNKKPRDNK